MTKIKLIFGSGPRVLMISALFLTFVYSAELYLNLPKMPISDFTSELIFGISIVLTCVALLWAIISLPINKRGKELVTHGAFKYIRHPLYASFLDFFVFGLAFYLKSYSLIFAGFILFLICGKLVEKEEKFVQSLFGEKYEEYRKRTKKFIPKIY